MDAADAARLTEAVTDAVADAVKRGESYSSLENFLTDESVERMTEAVIEEAAETLGLADAVRDGLCALGFVIEDTPQGPRVSLA